MQINLNHKPYNYKASDEEINEALAWWRNLSINQMKEFEKKYGLWPMPGFRQVHQVWEEEGKPQPQEVIPSNS
jgi:hypothetical protein